MNRAPSKHEKVFSTLEREIRNGHYAPGQKLPSEAAIVQRFGVSRITAGRAVRDLQRQGLVERRAGSGTYVRDLSERAGPNYVFGLLIPNLGETELFEPVCRGIAASPLAEGHALLWGNTPTPGSDLEEQARQLCRQYVRRRVDGVFFAPLELTASFDAVNREVLAALDDAGIPVILLDRDAAPYPERSAYDLVGIDNRRAGFLITRHFLHLGCRRIAFAAYRHSAATVDARISGYLEALLREGGEYRPGLLARLTPGREPDIRGLLDAQRVEAIVCANDRTAGEVMQALLAMGYRIPHDIRIAGIDDTGYAALLPSPLTSVHQPAMEIGSAAMAAMLQRIQFPRTPPREILLDCRVVVRRSCGSPSAR